MYFDYNENEESVMSEINVTPLVDVMLVLLIIFMITMPVLFTRLDLDFPTTSDSRDIVTDQEPNLLKITLDKNGTYYIDDKVASKDDIVSYINGEKSKKNSVVALNAEKTTNFQQLLDLIKILQENGVTKIGYMEEVR